MFDKLSDFGNWDRCLTRGLPGSFMPGAYNMGIRIMQSPGLVAIPIEMVHETRFIYLDGRDAPPADVTQYLGYSRGHWEGDTLVVETSHIESGTFMNNGFNHSDALKLSERFRLAPDGNTLWLTQVYEDPDVFEGLAARYMAWTRRPGEFVFPYECDPSYGE